MKIALFHYHLNAGGVTRVIENHLHALDAVSGGENVEVLIIVGNGGNALSADLAEQLNDVVFKIITLPRLSYDGCLEPRILVEDVEIVLADEGFHKENCVLHIHNHALGKNTAWPQAIWQLANHGYRMLLQEHDFIEDFRPQNYHKARAAYANATDEEFIKYLYPQVESIHYTVLNKRDERILLEAGLEKERLSVLPNPVFGEIDSETKQEALELWASCVGIPVPDRLILYPVRGITRKNVGEFLLHAALADTGTVYAITLPPANPLEAAHLDRWESFAKQHKLPCHFAVGTVEGLGFEENVAAADAIITTSVAEGFGMVYLEPWLMGKAVIGRDLLDITADFKDNDVEYEGLYAEICIPIEWVGHDAFVRQWVNTYAFSLHSYGIDSPGDDALAALAEEQIKDGCVDFAILTVDLQRQLLHSIIIDESKRVHLRHQLDPQMKIVDKQAIKKNADLIKERYSFDCIGKQLLKHYAAVKGDGASSAFTTLKKPSAVLDGFLRADRFCPLRVGD